MDKPLSVCPSCSGENPAGMRFCGHCGSALPTGCPACGRVSPDGMRFCGYCGAPLSPTPSTGEPVSPAVQTQEPRPGEERRLITALFCDLVGFTPLSETLDPEEVRDIQAAYFERMAEQIQRFEGTVEKYAGDAILALFGTPVAHEDDAERAVLCALGMQEVLSADASGPGLRVGVNTGEVVSGGWGASGKQDVAVTGDALNTAARLQSAAEAGEVLVGTETERLTRRRIEYGPRRELTLKGKHGAVPAYRALGIRSRLGERWEERQTPLLGREAEMKHLSDLWTRARGGEGQLVTLVGESGVGKSRLVAETVTALREDGVLRVIRGRSLSYGQEISLWLIADILRDLAGLRENDRPDRMREKLQETLGSLLADQDVETQAIARDVIGTVVGLPAGGSSIAHADAQVRRRALLRSLRLLLRALSNRAPTLLVIEDLHWADTASSDVLGEILADVPGLRVMVLAVQRPGWSAPWMEWAWPEPLRLRPLEGHHARALARAVLGGVELSADLASYLAERAGGNPFFLEEMLRALQEAGDLAVEQGEMRLVRGAAERLPATLTEVLLARLDRLEPEVRNVVQVASVIGRQISLSLLGDVLNVDDDTLEELLVEVQRAEIAFPHQSADPEYIFKHASMREAAYNTLVQRRRQQLHLATANAIIRHLPAEEYVEMIAYHFARTDRHAEAGRWLERSGDRAAEVYANPDAVARYAEARHRLTEAGVDRARLAELDEKSGDILSRLGRYKETLELLEGAAEVHAEARDIEAGARVIAKIGKVHRFSGTAHEGIARIEPVLALLDASGPSSGLAALHIALSHLYFSIGRFTESLASSEQASE
ncbi:MAG: AAA family ATPase, partial [Chloroflexota bacterium]